MRLSDMNDDELIQAITAQVNRVRLKLDPAEAEALDAPLAQATVNVECPRCKQGQTFAKPTVGELLALVTLHLDECKA